MKRNLFIVSLTLLMLVIFQTNSFRLQSHIAQPIQGGLSGDPQETTCSVCHTTSTRVDPTVFTWHLASDSAGLAAGPVMDTSARYTPGETIWLSLQLNRVNRSMPRFTPDFGFQCTALLPNDSMAGSFTLSNPNKTSIETSATAVYGSLFPNGNRVYVGHKNADTTHVWYFEWTAPPVGSGPVTFYFVCNLGDGDGTDVGDSIFKNSITIGEGPPTGISNIPGNISTATVYPIPLSAKINVGLMLGESSFLTISMLSADGLEVRNLYSGDAAAGFFSRPFDIGDLDPGVYLVSVRSGTETRVLKALKF